MTDVTEPVKLLSDIELLRYSRHILLPQIDVDGQGRLLASHVLIVGAGGLGCPVGLYLAAAGIGHITVVDGDRVELSNLQRQIAHGTDALGLNKADSLVARMRVLNPDIEVTAINEWLNDDNVQYLLKDINIVIDCSDNFSTRFLLNQHAVHAGIPLVSGAAIRGEGQLAVFHNDRAHACYACVYPDSDDQGDSCSQSGVLAPVVGVIGSLQAVETIKVLTQAIPADSYLLVFDAWQLEFRRLRLRRDPECRVCSCLPEPK